MALMCRARVNLGSEPTASELEEAFTAGAARRGLERELADERSARRTVSGTVKTPRLAGSGRLSLCWPRTTSYSIHRDLVGRRWRTVPAAMKRSAR